MKTKRIPYKQRAIYDGAGILLLAAAVWLIHLLIRSL